MDKAFDPNSQMKYAVEQGYPYFRQYGQQLSNQGVSFHDLTMIFANNTTTLYGDTCCHVYEEGSRIVAETIADAIIKEIE